MASPKLSLYIFLFFQICSSYVDYKQKRNCPIYDTKNCQGISFFPINCPILSSVPRYPCVRYRCPTTLIHDQTIPTPDSTTLTPDSTTLTPDPTTLTPNPSTLLPDSTTLTPNPTTPSILITTTTPSSTSTSKLSGKNCFFGYLLRNFVHVLVYNVS